MLLPLAGAGAQQAPDEQETEAVPTVEVSGIKHPELRSYRNLLAGLDTFEREHKLAPHADTLRFILKPQQPGAVIDGVTLRIAGGDTDIAVPVAADGGFVLPRSQAADDDNADLVLNRKRGTFSGKPEIRSANVPATMRRLGDIRLECQVMIAIAKKEINFAMRAVATVALGGGDWCASPRVHYGTPAPWPSDSATLVHGQRREQISPGRHQKYFALPIQDASWPDDTLIEFQPSAPATVAELTAAPLYLRGTMNKWGATTPLLQVDASTFSVDVALPKGLSRFRIGAKDFRSVELGGGDKQGKFVADKAQALAWAGRDLWFDTPQAATYTFALNVAAPDAPLLTVTRR
ncbi:MULTISPECIES: hypothetical protein [unclassified Duganella]|uniref:hypothetical protein n=1 Tax=unclassified Duganella TaxID=2636909 RepID=UPI00114CECB9|nr:MULTISPECIES: hypothetical protein [unclassified Duganella]